MKRTINTNLAKKKDLFDVLALSEAIGLPVLLIGDPGVAKTAAVMDYAGTALGEISNNDIFLLETDEGTRSNAVKGNIDLEALTTNNKYQVVSPIADAKFVIINEIDKASASLRNSLLGVMNEKYIFNGTEKKKCQWDAFVATCNEIPEDEKDSPFWDRFILKTTVNRMTAAQMTTYFEAGDKAYTTSVNVPMPTAADLAGISVPVDKLEMFVQMTKNSLSDRTLTFVPRIIKAVALIWNVSVDKAMIKTCELVAGRAESQQLAKALIPAEMKAVYNKLDMLNRNIDDIMAREIMTQITSLVTEGQQAGTFTESQIEELGMAIQDKIDNNEIGYLAEEENVEETETNVTW